MPRIAGARELLAEDLVEVQEAERAEAVVDADHDEVAVLANRVPS